MKRFSHGKETLFSFLVQFTTLVRQDLKKNLVIFFVGYFGMMSVFLAYGTMALQKKIETSRQIKEQKIKEYKYWISVIQQHPDYPDAYYNAAVYAYELNSPHQAKMLLDTALVLDPQFTEAIVLRAKIEE